MLTLGNLIVWYNIGIAFFFTFFPVFSAPFGLRNKPCFVTRKLPFSGGYRFEVDDSALGACLPFVSITGTLYTPTLPWEELIS